MHDQEIDFSLQSAGRNRYVQIGPTHIAIPFRNLVLKNAVVAKSIPGEPANVAVVLMSVSLPMGEDKVGIDPLP